MCWGQEGFEHGELEEGIPVRGDSLGEGERPQDWRQNRKVEEHTGLAGREPKVPSYMSEHRPAASREL